MHVQLTVFANLIGLVPEGGSNGCKDNAQTSITSMHGHMHYALMHYALSVKCQACMWGGMQDASSGHASIPASCRA